MHARLWDFWDTLTYHNSALQVAEILQAAWWAERAQWGYTRTALRICPYISPPGILLISFLQEASPAILIVQPLRFDERALPKIFEENAHDGRELCLLCDVSRNDSAVYLGILRGGAFHDDAKLRSSWWVATGLRSGWDWLMTLPFEQRERWDDRVVYKQEQRTTRSSFYRITRVVGWKRDQKR